MVKIKVFMQEEMEAGDLFEERVQGWLTADPNKNLVNVSVTGDALLSIVFFYVEVPAKAA